MASLSDLARHWSRQTEKGKGIRIAAAEMDVLNAIGVGELILLKVAEEQRQACNQRIQGFTPAADTGSSTTESRTEAFEPHSSRSFGMTTPPDVTASARRALRTSNRRKTN
jgi:hypothetical protein